MNFFVLPFWPGLPGRRDVASQWDYPGKIKAKVNESHNIVQIQSVRSWTHSKNTVNLYTKKTEKCIMYWQKIAIFHFFFFMLNVQFSILHAGKQSEHNIQSLT